MTTKKEKQDQPTEEQQTKVILPKELSVSIAAIKKQFGDDSIFRTTDDAKKDVKYISTKLLSLDRAAGGFGIAMEGRIIEIYGMESTGKTTLTLQLAAALQQDAAQNNSERGYIGFIDAEHALDLNYAEEKLGVDSSKMFISQPACAEDALEIADKLTRSGALDLIIVDSVAALTPKAELEGEMQDQQMGLQARLMSKAMRKLAGIAYHTKTTIIFINQIRHKIVMFGSPVCVTPDTMVEIEVIDK